MQFNVPATFLVLIVGLGVYEEKDWLHAKAWYHRTESEQLHGAHCLC